MWRGGSVMELQPNFDLNVLELIKDSLDSGIKSGKNILGASAIPYCSRKNIITNMYGVKTFVNNKMVFGMMYEDLIYKPKILKEFIHRLHSKFTIIGELTIVDTKKSNLWEFIPDHFIRLHPDIYTNLYSIEIKTTNVYVKEWKRELAVYQAAQLNTYLGYYKQPLGFLHKLSQRAFTAKIKQDDFYWDKLWEKYGYFLPLRFDEKMFDLTIERAEFLFKQIDLGSFEGVEGPEFIWECGYCNPLIKEKCDQPIKKQKLDYYQNCDHCSRKIEKEKFALFRHEKIFCMECAEHVRCLIR